MQLKKTATLIALGLLAASAIAGTSIDKMTLNPPSGAKVGDKVTATIEFANPGEGMCGIEVEFGDGSRETFKIKPDTKLPIVIEHIYQKPGQYQARVGGTKVSNAFSCPGKQDITYAVAAAPAPVAAAPVAKAAAAECPADWMLKGKVAKNGAFTCVPAKGVKEAKKPEKGLECPAGTSYFTKGKTLGCEAA